MNSDDEKALFDQYGWEYDSVQRHWLSPGGSWLTLDDVTEMGQTREGEALLGHLIVVHGRPLAPRTDEA